MLFRSINRTSLWDIKSIKSIEFANPLSDISPAIFSGLINLEEIIVHEDSEQYVVIDNILYSKINAPKDEYILYFVPEGLMIEEVFIYDNVVSIIPWGVSNKNIKKFIVSEENKRFCSVDGVLYTKDLKMIVKYPSGKEDAIYHIVEGTTEISSSVFEDVVNLQELYLPTTLEYIGDSFRYINNIEYLIIPKSVENFFLGNMYYDGILYLEHESIPDGWILGTYNTTIYLRSEWVLNEFGKPVLIEL